MVLGSKYERIGVRTSRLQARNRAESRLDGANWRNMSRLHFRRYLLTSVPFDEKDNLPVCGALSCAVASGLAGFLFLPAPCGIQLVRWQRVRRFPFRSLRRARVDFDIRKGLGT